MNQRSDSFPTVDRLVTLDPENVVDIPELQQLRHQVAITGKLPSQGVVITVTIPPTVSHFSDPTGLRLPAAGVVRQGHPVAADPGAAPR